MITIKQQPIHFKKKHLCLKKLQGKNVFWCSTIIPAYNGDENHSIINSQPSSSPLLGDGAFSVWGHFRFRHRQILLLPLEVLHSGHQEKVCQDSLIPRNSKTTLSLTCIHSEYYFLCVFSSTTLSLLKGRGHQLQSLYIAQECAKTMDFCDVYQIITFLSSPLINLR